MSVGFGEGATFAVSLVIPAYNEERRLGPTLAAWCDRLQSLPRPFEVIVVDDGSEDDTARVARCQEVPSPSEVRLVRLPVRSGKGAAVRAGMMVARGEVVAFTDADLAYAPGHLDVARNALADGADIAIGSRNLPSSRIVRRPPLLRRVAGSIYALLVGRLLRGITDSQCGFKVFRREAAQALFPMLTIQGFGFDVELCYLARLQGLRIATIPVVCDHAPASKVRLLGDSLRMLGDLARIRRNERRGVYARGTSEHVGAAIVAEPASERSVGS